MSEKPTYEELEKRVRKLEQAEFKHKLAEEALRKSEQRYRELVQNANSAIIRWRCDGTITFFNEYAQVFFGYSDKEIIGKHVSLLVPQRESTGADLTGLVQDIVDHPHRYNTSINENVCRDGRRVWIAWTNKAILDQNGKVAEILAVGSDITERKLAMEMVVRQNAILDGINTIFHEALSSRTDEDLGRICLSVVEDITESKFGFIGEIGSDGLFHDIAISDPGWELCTMYDKTEHRKPPKNFKIHGLHGRVLTDGKSLIANAPSSHPDSIGVPEGHPHLTAFLGVPLISDDKTIGMIAVGNRESGYREEDREALEALAPAIVESLGRKRAEDQVRKINRELEQRVAKRTELAEARAKQLQALAVELSDAEDRERRKIASILHDEFQQQLAYIKMELAMLQKDADKKVGQDLCLLEQLIGECIEKSRNLSCEINPPALRRSGLLAALDVLAQDMKDNYGLFVKVLSQPGAQPDTPALASVLYRIARELILNVAKHAGVDTVVIDVRSKNGMIYIRVEDFGNGFDYYALRSKQGRGSGFGLYSIEDRITFLGGSMKIKTAPGKGCCVMVTVPKDVSQKTSRAAPPPEDTVKPASMGAESSQTFDERGQIRILLADDHQLMREALAKLLQSCKELKVVGQAINGREVIQLAAQLKPDVILMDVTMPELDGFEATAQISREQPDTRIIGLSMHKDADTHQKMLEAGACAYLTKTGSPDTLVETIRRAHHIMAESELI